MEEVGQETKFLPCIITGGGTEVCVRAGGEGKIPHLDAHDGKIHGLPSSFLLPNVQSLPFAVGSSADGRRWVVGRSAADAFVGNLQ